MLAAIYFDDDLRAGANAHGANYWHVYTRELCGQMGLPHDELPRSRLTAEHLAPYRVLLLPDLEPRYLLEREKQALRDWVEGGGLLIGFATGGLHDLFGVRIEGQLPQPEDDFSLTATVRYTCPTLARPLLPPGEEDTPLPVAAPVKLVGRAEGRELARLVSLQGRDLHRPAVTLREVGEGQALYFCFNVAHSAWAMHHGRPVLDDYDGDGRLRMSDAMILRPFPTSLPYADLLVYLLRNVIARRGLALLHALPPAPDGSIPEALLHYGGDDEGASDLQVVASDRMRELGLPYHVNIMPDPQGQFGLSCEHFAHLKANGHETSLHFNFIAGVAHPYAFTRRDIQRQVDWYQQTFGELPVCTVFHCTTWCGWSEPADWMAGAGILGDNSRFISYSPPSNPVNTVGFGFGTAYPFFHYHDWRKDNDRLRFVGVPIGAYEAGYQHGRVEFSVLRRALDLARFWHLPLNLFYHPVYVAQYPECSEAIRQGLQYLEGVGAQVLHWGPDEVTRWWLARSETRVQQLADGTVEVNCPWRNGCVLQLICGEEPPEVKVDGAPAPALAREEHGARWLYVSVPAGEHGVRLTPGGGVR